MPTPTEKVEAGDLRIDALQEEPRETANERRGGAAAFGEGEAVAVDEPQDADDALDRENLRERRKHVLGANHAAVEQREPRNRHQENEQR